MKFLPDRFFFLFPSFHLSLGSLFTSFAESTFPSSPLLHTTDGILPFENAPRELIFQSILHSNLGKTLPMETNFLLRPKPESPQPLPKKVICRQRFLTLFFFAKVFLLSLEREPVFIVRPPSEPDPKGPFPKVQPGSWSALKVPAAKDFGISRFKILQSTSHHHHYYFSFKMQNHA